MLKLFCSGVILTVVYGLVLQLLKDISQKQRDPRQRQVDLRRAYITARFTPASLPAFFTLGDQLYYGGFENRALEPGQEYVFFILAELNSTSGVRERVCVCVCGVCVCVCVVVCGVCVCVCV